MFAALSLILSAVSIVTAVILKLFGLTWFNLQNYAMLDNYIDSVIRYVIICVLYYLIVGCAVRYEPKILLNKMLPFFPLVLILMNVPPNLYPVMSGILVISTCLTFIFKFKVILRCVINIVIMCVLQQCIIWLRLSAFKLTPAAPDTVQFVLMNIDQIVLLMLMYYVNRKEVKKIMGLFFLGNKPEKRSFIKELRKLGDAICRFFAG